MLSTPCPACDHASAIDEEGCCIHCGTPRWEDSDDDGQQAHLDSLLNLVCGHRAEFKEAYRYGPDAWCGHPDCRRYRERVGRAHD